MTDAVHVPVMLDRVVALVAPALERPGSVLVDATLGLGGHTEAVLDRCPQARVIGIDRDPQALARTGERLAAYGERLTCVHAVYDEIADVLADQGLAHVDGVLFDLGVSSMQLDLRDRGFSYAQDAPLDMRMDETAGRTAAEVVNTYPVGELTRILAQYGEERFARRIAQRIVAERAREPFTSTERLAELVRESIPAATRRTGGHPAKRTFQALRIEVNDELTVLTRALPAAIASLAVGGRIVVMSYHSLEDRLAKAALRAGARDDLPADLPVTADALRPELRLLTRGAEQASADEVAANPRAQSVRVRAAERLRASDAA
ncbi:16S rRNA (cytosine(1402)-N(4))-methyltransferase RsmH [Nocardioides sp. HDW12B]|uniref:16S rRNA (cytosine(1402)-N(4))-methyltransferase RsmH n=1 Tax=Nocardioides sp. HDW12B TaxID=2714939 RepID=UPI00140D7F9B|nr:16S rRNA (cytosine(1402)-N(4))-methyltransferase RsmH [Nocardioides sp. HDW12B]QIK66898.1 16S rRNA (cytosine(1402)-N(4))-methyltransferase RsmH [Nocardioides sp. HDW12B]